MGILDLPAGLWSWTDDQMSTVLPDIARIVTWGILGAGLSLGLYWLLSPQSHIARITTDERELKKTLRDDTIEMADGLAAAKALLRLALTRVGLVTVPVLVAALPLLSMMTWMEAHYSHNLPGPGQSAAVKVEPQVAHGRWVSAGAPPARVEVVDDRGALIQSLPVPVPVPVIEKRTWWNVLIGNPLGYLPEDGPVDRIDIDLPAKVYLSMGPDWIKGWLPPFIFSLLVASLLLKFAFRIH